MTAGSMGGLGALAQGMGEVADLGRVDDHDRQARTGEAGGDDCLEAGGSLAHRVRGGDGAEAT